MNGESSAEDVANDDNVRLGVVDGDAIHSQILRQQRVGVSLNYVLRHTDIHSQILRQQRVGVSLHYVLRHTDIHSQILRQQRVGVSLHYVLRHTDTPVTVNSNTQPLLTAVSHSTAPSIFLNQKRLLTTSPLFLSVAISTIKCPVFSGAWLPSSTHRKEWCSVVSGQLSLLPSVGREMS